MVVMVLTLHSICVLWLEISIFFQATLREENVLPHNVFQICTVESFKNAILHIAIVQGTALHTTVYGVTPLLWGAWGCQSSFNLHCTWVLSCCYIICVCYCLITYIHSRLLTYHTHALESSVHSSLCTFDLKAEGVSWMFIGICSLPSVHCVLCMQKHNIPNHSQHAALQQRSYLQPVQSSFSAYKGRSLPNVHQVASSSIDLQVTLSPESS